DAGMADLGFHYMPATPPPSPTITVTPTATPPLMPTFTPTPEPTETPWGDTPTPLPPTWTPPATATPLHSPTPPPPPTDTPPPSPTAFSTSTSPPQPTSTPPPTSTPAFTWTPLLPTGTPFDTATPDQTPPSTATATPSKPACGIRLAMPVQVLPGDVWYVLGFLYNHSETEPVIHLFLVLQVSDMFWFWPAWTCYRPDQGTGLDFETRVLRKGTEVVRFVEPLIWPDTGSQSMTDLWFHGAMLNEDMSMLAGEMDSVSWGFGPSD
ncbi:hypothetical protein JW979_11535, partial [bacterium]|nr:hypothetical protein [candidate division CSSED10-310 bacterium]